MLKFTLSKRGKRLAAAGEWLSRGVAIVSGVIVAWMCADSARFENFALAQIGRVDLANGITQQAWMLGSAVFVVGVTIFIWLMMCCANLFATLKTGDVFGTRTEQMLVRLSQVLLVAVGFGIVQETLLSLALRVGSGTLPVVFTLSSDDGLGIILAIFLVLFAQIVREARRARFENSQFI